MWFGNGKQGCRVVNDKAGNARALVVRPGGVGGKVGTMGTWVAAVYGKHVLVRALMQEAGEVGEYADRSSVQLFQSREFWELETLSRVKELQIGERLSLEEKWAVLERPAGMGEDELALWVDKQMQKAIACGP